MEKDCNNCYWMFRDIYGNPVKNDWCTYENNRPSEGNCISHEFECCECEDEQAEYKYNDKYYCFDCLLKEKGAVVSGTVTHYELDGEWIGSSDDISEIIGNLGRGIEEIYC